MLCERIYNHFKQDVYINRHIKYIAFLFAMFLAITIFHINQPKNNSNGSWIWSHNKLSDAIDTDVLYIMQGAISKVDNINQFYNQGLRARFIDKNVYLVLRMNTLDDSDDFLNLIDNLIWQWEIKGTTILGIQLDYDSATLKLASYATKLETIRSKLPSKYKLSITGLMDWLVSGNISELESISNFTDEIVFQLYQINNYYNLNQAFVAFNKATFDFKVGLLNNHHENSTIVNNLRELPNFTGYIKFIIK